MTKAARDRALSQLKSSPLRRNPTTSTPLTSEDDTDIDTNVDLFDPPQASGSTVSIYKTQEVKLELGPAITESRTELRNSAIKTESTF